MREFIYRHLARQLDVYRQIFPAVAILGPRQCGKSTFVKQISKNWRDAVYLDLQSPADFNKLNDPLLFFESNADKIVFLDEIQLKPELFSVLRSAIDGRRTNGRFILLGS
ncbi:MAG: ATPase, partial [Proteobacteria bacterium]|nr:ATPase [Pseudomonadota bacterium]